MPESDTILGTMPNSSAAEWLRGKALTNARVLRDMKPEVRARAFAVSGIEDMRRRTGISKTNIEILREHGCLEGMGVSDQIALFS